MDTVCSAASVSARHRSSPHWKRILLGLVKAESSKPPSSISPARSAAFEILLRVAQEDAYASELLHSARYARLSTPDHGLATELVMGVLRWQSRLDEQIARASSQPLRKLDLEVLIALRLGTYQLLWLERIPKHAAINESVELVKKARKRSAAGFVNAVLRKLSASNRDSGTTQTRDPADLASRLAHPEWLIKRWVAEFGVEGATRICEYDQHPPTTTIRLRDPNLQEELANAGVGLSPG